MTDIPEQNNAPFSIVVVDDDAAVRFATGRLLRQKGYKVAEAACGKEGESLISTTNPDLVLMDVNLGDADGRDLCKQLRLRPEQDGTLFVLTSNSAKTIDDQVTGLNNGADGYITRPIENRELLARVLAFQRIAEANKQLKETISELNQTREQNRQHINELERFNQLMVNRELRMIELKKEVNQLCRELGREEPYQAYTTPEDSA